MQLQVFNFKRSKLLELRQLFFNYCCDYEYTINRYQASKLLLKLDIWCPEGFI